MESILVSIIMPSYNTPSQYLREAIFSILQQTYHNFELLIIDDGSKYSVANVISDINDNRINIIRNESNQGLSFSLNKGLEQAKGKYIFRMDSDDRSINTRLRRQIDYLEQHPNIDVLSSFAKCFGEKKELYKSATVDDRIKAELLWKNPIIHPTVAIRACTMNKYNVRYNMKAGSEDYDIWSRMAFVYRCKFAAISEVLLEYRVHSGQITVNKQTELWNSEKDILISNFIQLGLDLSEKELDLYHKFRTGRLMSYIDLEKCINIMNIILKQIPEDVSKRYLKYIYRKQILKHCLRDKRYNELFLLKNVH